MTKFWLSVLKFTMIFTVFYAGRWGREQRERDKQTCHWAGSPQGLIPGPQDPEIDHDLSRRQTLSPCVVPIFKITSPTSSVLQPD